MERELLVNIGNLEFYFFLGGGMLTMLDASQLNKGKL
jgi:hypothetical protein